MACRVLLFIIAGSLVAAALGAPAEVTETKGSVPEKDDLQTAASHWGGGLYGGWGHYGGYGGYGYYPHYGYWGWPSHSWYGHGYPYGHGYWW